MAGAMVGQLGGTNDNLARLSALVDEEREKAAGRARVARDTLGAAEFRTREHGQRALAEQALEDFAASEGIPLPPASEPTGRHPTLGNGEAR